MKKATSLIGILLVFIVGFMIFISGDPNKSEYTYSSGYQYKEFGSSSSSEGKPLILENKATYEFSVKAKMKEGYLSVILWNYGREKELLKIEGNNIDKKKDITLEPGEYTVEIRTNDAKDGKFTIKYGEK